MSRRVVTTLRMVVVHQMTAPWRAWASCVMKLDGYPTTYWNIVTQVCYTARTYLLSQVHVSSFVILYGSHN